MSDLSPASCAEPCGLEAAIKGEFGAQHLHGSTKALTLGHMILYALGVDDPVQGN